MAKRATAAQVVRDYQATFNTPAGQVVLHDMMKSFGILRSTWNEDPHKMSYLEGQRSVILRLLTLLKTDPAVIERRMEEYVRSSQVDAV